MEPGTFGCDDHRGDPTYWRLHANSVGQGAMLFGMRMGLSLHRLGDVVIFP